MTSRTAWTGGNLNSGSVAYQAAFGSEVSTLANGYSVLSSIDFDNTTGVDEFMDISIVATIASSTIVAGAYVSFFIAPLQGDTTTYGDGTLTTSTANVTPTIESLGALNLFAATGVTKIAGTIRGISLTPCKFALAVQNGSGFNFTACSIWIRTYNQNLNN